MKKIYQLNNQWPMPGVTTIDLKDFHCIPIDALSVEIQIEVRKYGCNDHYTMIKSDLDRITCFVNGNIPRMLYFETIIDTTDSVWKQSIDNNKMINKLVDWMEI